MSDLINAPSAGTVLHGPVAAASAPAVRKPLLRGLAAKKGIFARYAAGSVVAMGCSELVLIGAVGLTPIGATAAAALAWAAGAVPNYVLNRRWAWKRDRSASFRREVLPYWIITIATAAAAVAATKGADEWLRRSVSGRAELSVLLGVAYFAAYGVVFVIKFALFDGVVFKRRAPGAARD